MFSSYKSSPQGYVVLPSPSCSRRVGRVGGVVRGIWGFSHPLQISHTHVSGHPSLRSAQRLSSSHLQSANIFSGQNETGQRQSIQEEQMLPADRIFLQHLMWSHLQILHSAFKDLKMLSSKKRRPVVSILITKGFHKVIWLWVCWWFS